MHRHSYPHSPLKTHWISGNSKTRRERDRAATHCYTSAHQHNASIIIIIINDIYRAQSSQVQQMRQVSCCMVTVVLEQEHF